MSSRDQQDECPKTFGCLPESCGDCPRDQQDERAAKLYRIVNRSDEYAIAAFNRRRDALRGTSLSGFPEDNERSDLLREGFHYGQDHGRAEGVAMGVRMATEQIVAWLRDPVQRADDTAHMFDPAEGEMVADAIERGEHKEQV